MKYFVLFLVVLAANSLNAQTIYEAPYVKDGQSFKFNLPDGYYRVGNKSSFENDVYTRDPSKTMDEFTDGPEEDMYMIGVFDNDNLDSPLYFFNDELRSDNNTVILEEPTTLTTAGGDLLQAVVSVKDGKFSVNNMRIAITSFKEKLVMLMYFPPAKEELRASRIIFEKIVSSYLPYKTDRENQLDINNDEDFDFFQNSEFETALLYEDVFFEIESEDKSFSWEEAEDKDMKKLLLSYAYKQKEGETWIEHGMVKVFSGGDLKMYSDNASKNAAINKVFPNHIIQKTASMSTFKNEELEFTEYSFTTGVKTQSAVQAIYSTTFKGELIFIVAEKTNDANDKFGTACKELLMTMWFWDEEAYEKE